MSDKNRTIRIPMNNKCTLLIASVFLILCVYLKDARAKANNESQSTLQLQDRMLSNVPNSGWAGRR